MSRYRDVIQQARKQESQETGLPENQDDQNGAAVAASENGTEPKEPEVNLSIKVPRALRRHWVAEAKRQDTSLTAAITEALKARFGEPV
jgi:predicted HicB family RNase H-like nuclease